MCTSALQERYVNFYTDFATLMDRPAALQETVFSRFFEQAEIAAFDRDELRGYRESQKDFWDLNSVIETAQKRGWTEGREEGRAEGRAEGRTEGEAIGAERANRENAASMKSEGIPHSVISRITGLSEEVISNL